MTRLLIWSPNYAPELIGIPPLVTAAAEWLVDRGHTVDVVTAVPNYPDRVVHPAYDGVLYRSSLEHGVRVHRSWLRVRPNERFLDKALYEASFSLVSAPRVIRRLRRADVVVCVVPSLVAATIAAFLPTRRLVLWVQDLVSAAAATVADAPGRALLVARRLERLAAGRADGVVVCSPGFADHLAALGIPRARISTVYNWVDTEEITPPERSANGRVSRFLYAGNLGYTQGFETLADALGRAGGGIELDIVGAGNAADQVRALGLPLRPPVPREELPALLAQADVHLVIQRRVAAGANLPSKIATYLASGRPIVASLALDTPAARLLEESGGAVLVPPERPDLLADAMVRVRDDAELRRRLGAAGRAYAVAHLDKNTVLRRLESAFVG